MEPALKSALSRWCSLLRPGDWLVLLLAAGACAALFPLTWHSGIADKALIRLDGQLVAELDLHQPRLFAVSGPLGTTVIAIEPGRARVKTDPGPRQYCVRQGWLSRPGEIV